MSHMSYSWITLLLEKRGLFVSNHYTVVTLTHTITTPAAISVD